MMKLGKDTGSIVNHVYSRSRNPEPVVGMGATLLSWTDRTPCTVTKVEYDKKRQTALVTIQEDRAVLDNGTTIYTGQEWKITPNPSGWERYVRVNLVTGKAEVVSFNIATKRWRKVSTLTVVFGIREKYVDPHF